jgi:hypothetical protein
MSTAVQMNAMAKAHSPAATEQTVVHGGHKYTSRPEAREGEGFLGTGLSLFTCMWIAGAIMWAAGDAKVAYAGKVMFAIGITVSGLSCCVGTSLVVAAKMR